MSYLKLSKKKYSINGVIYYYDKEENVITRFVTAEYLLWEQKYKDQKMFKEDMK